MSSRSMIAVALGALLLAEAAFAEPNPSQPFLLSVGERFALNDAVSPPAATMLVFVKSGEPDTEDILAAVQKEVASAIAPKGGRVVATLDGGSPAEAKSLVEKLGLEFTLIGDERGIGLARVAMGGFPRVVLVDRKYSVTMLDAGFDAARAAKWRAAAEGLLAAEAAKVTPTPTAAPSTYEKREETAASDKPKEKSVKVYGDSTDALYGRDIRGNKFGGVRIGTWLKGPPDTTNKFVLYDFFAMWCAPCLYSFKAAEQVLPKFEDRLAVIAISEEPAADVVELAGALKSGIGVGIDTEKYAMESLKIEAIPFAILTNPQGVVVWQGNPIELWAENGKLLRQILDESKAAETKTP